MKKIYNLISYELIKQNHVIHVIRYAVQFSILSTICLYLCLPNHENNIFFIIIFTIITLPLAAIGFTKDIIRCDIYDGSMELLLSTCDPHEIILSKFCALCINYFISIMISTPVIYVIFSVPIGLLLYSTLCKILLIIQISVLSIFVGSIESYFRGHTDLLLLIIIPLSIPGIILSGLVIYDTSIISLYITALFGITLLISPITLILSSYLIKHIYSTS